MCRWNYFSIAINNTFALYIIIFTSRHINSTSVLWIHLCARALDNYYVLLSDWIVLDLHAWAEALAIYSMIKFQTII